MNVMKYPTTKRDSPLRDNFKNFQQTEPVEILLITFGGLLTLQQVSTSCRIFGEYRR